MTSPIRALVGLVIALAVAGAHAAGVALFDPKSEVPLTQARAVLPQAEVTRLLNRVMPRSKRTAIVPMNLAAIDSSTISVTIDGKVYEYTGVKACSAETKACVWSGRSPSKSFPGRLSLAVGAGGGIEGVVEEGGRRFRLSGAAGSRHQFFSELMPPRRTVPDDTPTRQGSAPMMAPQSSASGMRRALDAPVATIRILTVFTGSAASNYGDRDQAALQFIQQITDSFTNSGIPVNIVSAGTFLVSNLGYLDGVTASVDKAQADPLILQQRDLVSADIVMLAVDTPAYSRLGQAWTIHADADTAFAAFEVDQVLEAYTYAHEFGHILGARHQAVGAVDPDPVSTPYSFGHGYAFRTQTTVAGEYVCFHTLMSNAWDNTAVCNFYNYDGGDPHLLNWSNPNQSYGGNPIGDALSHDAAVIVQEAPRVANFHTIPICTGTCSSGGGSGGDAATAAIGGTLQAVVQLLLLGDS